MNINPMTFAARDFSLRRGASDEHIPPWICKERAAKSGGKGPAALRVAPNLACGFVARRSQPHLWGMLPPRACPSPPPPGHIARIATCNATAPGPMSHREKFDRSHAQSVFENRPPMTQKLDRCGSTSSENGQKPTRELCRSSKPVLLDIVLTFRELFRCLRREI